MFRWGIILALAVLALDQLTKAMIVANIAESTAGSLDIREITPFFNIWHVRNSGMAFSLGNFNDGGRYFIGILAFMPQTRSTRASYFSSHATWLEKYLSG